jgi:PAS domain-containing protein
LARVRARRPHELEYTLPSGQVLNVRYTPIADDGLGLAYADVTAGKRAEEQVAQKEAELQVALDNMPGALVFTDVEQDLVFGNDRFAEM